MTTPKKGRKGPSESATKFPVGTEKKGNDGRLWVVVVNKNGVQHWKKEGGIFEVRTLKKSKKVAFKKSRNLREIYFTLDREYFAFMIIITNNDISIYKANNNLNSVFQSPKEKDYNMLVYFKNYKNFKRILLSNAVYIHKDKRVVSILLHLNKNKYCYIGDLIYEFEAPEKITHFGCSINAPYDHIVEPIAISKNNLYFLMYGDTEGKHRDESNPYLPGYMPKIYFPKRLPIFGEGWENNEASMTKISMSYMELWGYGIADNNWRKSRRKHAKIKKKWKKKLKKLNKLKIIEKRLTT